MADRSGLKLVGLIFASVTIAVMLTTTVVVKGYADGQRAHGFAGVYALERTTDEGR